MRTPLKFFLSGLFAFIALGCGLSGGSVPTGNPGPARLSGTVFDAQDVSFPIAKAFVEIVTPEGKVIRARTDAEGRFLVEVERGKKFLIRIRPPEVFTEIFEEQEVEIEVEADEEEVHLILLLPRGDGQPIPQFMAMRIEPEEVTLKVGEQVHFQVTTTPPANIRPIWSVHGGIGIITPDGLFTATHPGQGRVVARFRRFRAFAQVFVHIEEEGQEKDDEGNDDGDEG